MVKKLLAIIGLIIFYCINIFPMNVIKPYDVFLRPQLYKDKKFQFFSWVQAGIDSRGFDDKVAEN